MIAGVIRWSARNLLLILIATAAIVGGGLFAVGRLSLDAIPDLSDTQVIVYTEMPGQAPQVVEDQVTYPLTTALLAVPKSRAVRGFSFFGVSFVYVIFEDGTDIYWARSRVLEYLNSGTAKLPAGVKPALGPDATGVGWVYQYVVVGANRTLAELRSLQDWYIRFGLAKAAGVAEVASVGGFVRQYNVVVDPVKLRSYGVPLSRVVDAIRASNRETGGRVVEMAEAEFMVRGRGYLTGTADLEQIVLKADGPTPVLMRDVARIELGPDERRGLSELNGEGEAVGGIALQRFGQNALDVIDNVKAKLARHRRRPARGRAHRDRLRPLGADPSRHRHAEIDPDRGEPGRRGGVHRLPAARALGAGRHRHPAGRRADGLHRHAGAGHRLQHHEPGRHRHRHRRHGRRRHRHDRERPQASRTAAAGPVARRGHHRRGGRGRAGAVLQPADHHRVVPADLRPGGPGGPAVQAAGLDQEPRHGGIGAAVDHPGAGADDAVRARPHPAGASQPGEPRADLALSAGDPAGAARAAADDRGGGRRAGRHGLAGDAAGGRVHAEPRRGHACSTCR